MEQIGQVLHRPSLTLIPPAHSFHKEAIDYQKQGDLEEAEECYLKALSLAEKAYQLNPTKSKVSQDLAALYLDYGRLLNWQSRFHDAREAYRQAHEHGWEANRLTPHQPKVQNLFKDIGLQYNRFLLTQGETDQADKIFDSVVQSPSSASQRARIIKYFSASSNWVPDREDADLDYPSFRVVNSAFDNYLGRLAPYTKPFFTQPLQPATTLPYRRDEAIQETRHLAWCIQQNDVSPEKKAAWMSDAEKVVEVFSKIDIKNLAHVQEIVALASIDHTQLHRNITNALLNGLQPEKNRFLNLFLLRGVSVMMLYRRRLTHDPHVVGDCVALLLALLNFLDNIHIYKNREQTQTLLHTLSLVLDLALDYNLSGIDRDKFEPPLNNTLNRFDNKEKYPELAWIVEYIRQKLVRLPNNESLSKALLRRVGAGLEGGMYLTAFGLKLVGTHGVALAAEAVASDTFASVYASFKKAFDGIKWLKRAPWYGDLCFIDLLIGAGRLDLLEQQINGTWDEPLLRGLCDRLEQLAYSQTDPNAQSGALKLLKALEFGQVKWAQHISSIQQYAKQNLNRLALMWPSPNIEAMERGGYAPRAGHPFWSAPPSNQLWKGIPLPSTPAELRRALKEQYVTALEQDQIFQKTIQLYVAPSDRVSRQTTDPFPLLRTVQNLLKDKHVILLTGDSGAGKTTFNRMLEKQLWEEKQEPELDLIPLLISLSSIDKPEHDLIAKALKKRGLSESQIQRLKQEKQEFVFILDGYDEIRQPQNLYLSNHINQPDGWQGRMVISCRSEYLGHGYRSRFQPNPQLLGDDPSFREVVIEPFSPEERDEYVKKYVQHNQPDWTVQQYDTYLRQPHLQVLVSNPFLLRVVLDTLPYLENEGRGQSAIQLRLDLYDQFARHWFERNEQRLSAQNLTGKKNEIFRVMPDDDFAQHGLRFVQDLAVHLYTKNAGNPVVEYSLFKDEGSWKDAFFGREEKKQLLREAWPMTGSGNQYHFIHKSLLEYFVARALFESLDACTALSTRSHRRSDASIYSFEDQPTLPSRMLPDVSLAPKHWVSDLGVVQWLTDRVKQEPTFKEQLLAIIKRSKIVAGVRQAAANAITILVRAGVQFNGADFKGIQIPGADLSYGVLDSAQFQSIPGGQQTDLRKVCLKGAWLRSADFSAAKMQGVQFGELPSLRLESRVNACCYSPDGRYLVATIGGLSEPGKLALYEVETLAHVHTFEGHTSLVTSVAFSSDGQTLVSGSWDNTVQLWSVSENKPVHTFKGHTNSVTSVAFSSDGQTLASGSDDNTVRLWSVAEQKPWHTFKGHTNSVTSVAFSSDGQTLASGGRDATLRLWSVAEQKPWHTFEGHTHEVTSVAFSSDGQTLASGSWDNTVRLWSVAENKPVHTFEGHTDSVTSVAFSGDGQTLASGSWDNTVRLWSVAENKPVHTFEGHTDSVTSVAFSSDGQTLASGSWDNMVRLWSVTEQKPWHTFEGHTHEVRGVAFSSDGQTLASGSWDDTVRLWSVAENKPVHTFKGHTNSVTSVAFSGDGQTLASGSDDNMVRLWSVAENKPVHTFKGHTNSVTSVAFSNDGQTLASGSWDKTVRLWSVAENKPVHTFDGHTKMVTSVAFSSDGQTLASGSGDWTVRLWSITEQKPWHTFEGHTHEVTSVAFSSNGQTLASGSEDKTVRLWSAAEKKLLHSFKGHTHFVTSVAFSSDGRILASGSDDKTVRLWSMTSGQCLTVIQGFNGGVNSVAWYTSAEGVWLATGSDDKVIRLWQVHWDGETCRVTLHWASAQTTLTAPGMSIQEVIGLSARNAQLLKQRGATGEPHQTEEQEARPLLTQSAEAPAFTLKTAYYEEEL